MRTIKKTGLSIGTGRVLIALAAFAFTSISVISPGDAQTDADGATPGIEPDDAVSETAGPAEVGIDDALAIFGMLSAPQDIDASKAALGDRLFHDPRLSANDAISCATCHDLASGGDDGLQFSIGVSGKLTQRNSPSVFNLDSHVAYFWDGRVDSLEEQIDGPIHHPDEMGTDWPTIVRKLNADPALVRDMTRLYGGVSEAALKDALVQFERSLVTNDSPFDAFLAGDAGALTPEARRGLSRFVSYGCASCHQGQLVGGNLFQQFGLYLEQDREEPAAQLKVPSLRNVAHTAPYFHDGREPDLTGAVRTMAQAQLGRTITQREAQEIASFLHALSSRRFSGPENNASR